MELEEFQGFKSLHDLSSFQLREILRILISLHVHIKTQGSPLSPKHQNAVTTVVSSK